MVVQVALRITFIKCQVINGRLSKIKISSINKHQEMFQEIQITKKALQSKNSHHHMINLVKEKIASHRWLKNLKLSQGIVSQM